MHAISSSICIACWSPRPISHRACWFPLPAKDRRVLNSLSSIMMVSGLAFMGTAPFVADYIVLAAGLLGLVLAMASRDSVLRSWPSLLLVLSLLLVGITIP